MARNSDEFRNLINGFQRVILGQEEDKPMPLGLTLTTTSSFMDLVQKTVSEEYQGNSSEKAKQDEPSVSSFTVIHFRIGGWERASLREGDLVGEIHFYTSRLAWEIRESEDITSKIEMKWSGIAGLRAAFRRNQPDVLEVELNQPPMFYRRLNDPDPRRHPRWIPVADFTRGEAQIHRRHYVECHQGALKKHFEKLLRSDIRFHTMSRGPFPATPYQYFPITRSIHPHLHPCHLLQQTTLQFPFPHFRSPDATRIAPMSASSSASVRFLSPTEDDDRAPMQHIPSGNDFSISLYSPGSPGGLLCQQDDRMMLHHSEIEQQLLRYQMEEMIMAAMNSNPLPLERTNGDCFQMNASPMELEPIGAACFQMNEIPAILEPVGTACFRMNVSPTTLEPADAAFNQMPLSSLQAENTVNTFSEMDSTAFAPSCVSLISDQNYSVIEDENVQQNAWTPSQLM